MGANQSHQVHQAQPQGSNGEKSKENDGDKDHDMDDNDQMEVGIKEFTPPDSHFNFGQVSLQLFYLTYFESTLK